MPGVDITARVPSQRTALVDSLDLWCVLCMLRYEEGRWEVHPSELAGVEDGKWQPSSGELTLLAAQPGDLGWTELALGPLLAGLAREHPGWEGEALVHLAGVLAHREARLRVLLRSEWVHERSKSVLELAQEGFPSVQSLEWRPQRVRG